MIALALILLLLIVPGAVAEEPPKATTEILELRLQLLDAQMLTLQERSIATQAQFNFLMTQKQEIQAELDKRKADKPAPKAKESQ